MKNKEFNPSFKKISLDLNWVKRKKKVLDPKEEEKEKEIELIAERSNN
jgi:hypothetical protein